MNAKLFGNSGKTIVLHPDKISLSTPRFPTNRSPSKLSGSYYNKESGKESFREGERERGGERESVLECQREGDRQTQKHRL